MSCARAVLRPASSCAIAVGLLALASCGAGDGTATAKSDRAMVERHAPLEWQRALRLRSPADEVRVVFVTELGRLPRARSVISDGRSHVVTLFARALRRRERAASITGCVTIRSEALGDRGAVVDGAGRGSPSLYRRLHTRKKRQFARDFHAVAKNCPLLPHP
jgi:hypothetical protein